MTYTIIDAEHAWQVVDEDGAVVAETMNFFEAQRIRDEKEEAQL